MVSQLNVVLLAATCGVASADLPVHCLKHQVEGDWDFYLGPSSNKRSSCGHKHPDTEDGQPARSLVSVDKSLTQRVSLHSPNVATSKEHHGTWTMIYDEGFEVAVGGYTYMAFSNFTFETNPKTYEKANTSHCGETMVGWYRNADRTEFGCYYGSKVQKMDAQPLPSGPAASKAASSASTKLDSEQAEDKVTALNKKLSMLQLGWTAYAHDKWVGKTMQEVNSYAGLRRTLSVRSRKEGIVSQRRAKSFLQANQHTQRLPDTFDWSNASNGVDWLEPVMDQGDCGSCYAASTMRMISVRHKIAQKDPEAMPFSINTPLQCGEYNQGCKGGYGSLIAKWGEDVGLVPATCMRYNTAGSCKLECDLEKLEGKKYRVANHRLIGGWYGNSSSRAMMDEIYNNGPIVVSFEPAEDFMFYSEGIYRSAPANKTRSLRAAEERIADPWERVDHAVLAVGWGEEDGVKYWRIQNSWGPDWGEDGFFRMLRDQDESGVESIPEAADVVEDEQNGRRMIEFFAQTNEKH